MKIPNNISTVLIIILLSGTMYLKGQSPGQSLQNNYFGFDSIEWKRISGRYERAQTRADVILRSGTEICGQIVLIDSNKMILYPGYDVIINPDFEGDFKDVALDNISRIKIRRNTKNYEAMIILGLIGGAGGLMGGAVAMWTDGTIWNISPFVLGGAASGGLLGKVIQQSPIRYNFDKKRQNASQNYNSLKRWSVFKDNISYYSDFRDLVENSELTARIFPDKRIKFTAAIDPAGRGTSFRQTLDKGIGESYPVNYYESREFTPAISFSAALKIRENIYIGAGWFTSQVPGSYNYQLSDTVYYTIDPYRLRGYKIFAEYTPVTIDRYLSKRMEIITGAGIVCARSNQDIRWFSINNDGVQTDFGSMDFYEKKITGMFAKVLANYYFSPTTSVFGGLEGNLFKSIEVPAVNSLDLDYGSPIDISIPEYKIKYSSLRLSIGINFYF